MIDWLIELDQNLMLYLNDWGDHYWDQLFIILSHKWYAVPFYAVLLYFIYKRLGLRGTLVALVMVAAMIAVSDQLANLFKKVLFLRPRPCHQDGFEDLVSEVAGRCGGRYGFYSAHASSSMALAVYIFKLFKKYAPVLAVITLIWALAVGYSRIYLGVHYPGDVFVGMLIGAALGAIFGYLTLRTTKNWKWVSGTKA